MYISMNTREIETVKLYIELKKLLKNYTFLEQGGGIFNTVYTSVGNTETLSR